MFIITKKQKQLLFSAFFITFGFIVCILFFNPIIIYAANSPPTTVGGVANMAEIQKIARAVIPWFDIACTLAVAFSILQLIVSRDQKTVSAAYKYIGTVFSIFLIFNTIGSFFSFVDSTVNKNFYNYSTGQNSSQESFEGKTKKEPTTSDYQIGNNGLNDSKKDKANTNNESTTKKQIQPQTIIINYKI